MMMYIATVRTNSKNRAMMKERVSNEEMMKELEARHQHPLMTIIPHNIYDAQTLYLIPYGNVYDTFELSKMFKYSSKAVLQEYFQNKEHSLILTTSLPIFNEDQYNSEFDVEGNKFLVPEYLGDYGGDRNIIIDNHLPDLISYCIYVRKFVHSLIKMKQYQLNALKMKKTRKSINSMVPITLNVYSTDIHADLIHDAMSWTMGLEPSISNKVKLVVIRNNGDEVKWGHEESDRIVYKKILHRHDYARQELASFQRIVDSFNDLELTFSLVAATGAYDTLKVLNYL